MSPLRIPARVLARVTIVLAVASNLLFVAHAQLTSVRVIVIASLTGASASVGAAQRVALLGARPAGVDLTLYDDGSDPGRALAAAETALAAGAEAMICCSSAPATRAVAELAQARGVLLLTPGAALPLALEARAARFAFGLGIDASDEWRALGAHLAATGRRAVGLITLANAFGDDAAARLGEQATSHGLRIVADERIGPDEQVVTPQALWVATRQPDAVVVWGLRPDTERAVDALRRRGYRGPIYVRRALEIDGRGFDPARMAGVRLAVIPARVAGSLEPDDPRAAPARRLAAALRGVGGYRDVPEAAALTVDAAALIAAAHDQASIYGVDRGARDAYRQALRDAAVALPPRAGAGGIADLVEGEGGAGRPTGLVFAEVTAGGLVAVDEGH